MARHLGNLWRCLVGFFCLIPSLASATLYPSLYQSPANYVPAAVRYYGTDPLSACQGWYNVNAPGVIAATFTSSGFEGQCGDKDGRNGVSWSKNSTGSCPTNSTLSGSVCVCNSGFVEEGGQCLRACSNNQLGSGSSRWTYQGDYPGFGGYCINGCSYALYGTEGYDKTSNMSAATGYMKGTGSRCNGTNTPRTSDTSVSSSEPSTAPTASTPDVTACKSGQVPYTGTVNGKTVTVCGAPSKTSGTQTETTSNSSSTTTNNNGTQTTSTTNTGDSKTTKTTCENGTCTTTTTSSSSSGGGSGTSGGSSSSGTQTKTESQESFCKANPQALVCKQQDESSFGGSCGAFSCSGDAVQCAQARAAHDLLCEVKLSDTDPNVIAGKAGASGGLVPGDHPGANGQTQAFALSSMLDSTPLFGTSGDCIADKTVPMMGQTLTLPFSRMCGALELLGNAFLAACFLAAGMIVFRT